MSKVWANVAPERAKKNLQICVSAYSSRCQLSCVARSRAHFPSRTSLILKEYIVPARRPNIGPEKNDSDGAKPMKGWL